MLTPASRNSFLRNQRQLETATKINTSSCSPQKHQVKQFLARLLHIIASCCSTADDANMFCCPDTDHTQDVAETVQQRRSTTNSIMVMGG